MAERIRLRIRAYVIIDIIPDTTSSPPSFNGGSSSSTPRMAPVGTPPYRQPPPGFSSPPVQPRPEYSTTDFARRLDVLTSGNRQIYGVDPSESSN